MQIGIFDDLAWRKSAYDDDATDAQRCGSVMHAAFVANEAISARHDRSGEPVARRTHRLDAFADVEVTGESELREAETGSAGTSGEVAPVDLRPLLVDRCAGLHIRGQDDAWVE